MCKDTQYLHYVVMPNYFTYIWLTLLVKAILHILPLITFVLNIKIYNYETTT